jgi:ADP-dependent NAD(P)H-hydrate dehydratase / NAD(P)H-hydrate epimerase
VRILTAEAMRGVDQAAIEGLGIPSLVLMENAALGVADAIGERFPRARAVALFCGPGNNGGDGLAVARHLAARNYRVHLFVVGGGRQPAGDAGVQLAICRRLELPLWELRGEEELPAVLAAARESDLVVDALFGTGLGRPLEGLYAALVTALNRLPLPRLAVDLPSGLSGSRCEVPGPHLEADLTVTFAAPKLAHVFPPAAEAVGELVVADLGIPPQLVEAAAGDLHLLEADEVAALLPARRPQDHKGDCGHALLVAGGPGRAGAVVLAARAAVRSGAGLVTAAVPASIRDLVDLGSLESLTLGLPADAAGELAAGAAAAILEAARGKQAVALGPGLGRGEETAAAIRGAVLACPLPLVLDADGVNAFAGRAGELAGREAPTVLTPHPGEIARLLATEVPRTSDQRLDSARRAAAECRAVAVLKGHLTLVASPGGPLWVNPTGNPGMATGGSGDVLTGMIAALLAQGMEAADAARAGVFLHGLAGDRATARLGERALAAGDLIAALGETFQQLAAR